MTSAFAPASSDAILAPLEERTWLSTLDPLAVGTRPYRNSTNLRSSLLALPAWMRQAIRSRLPARGIAPAAFPDWLGQDSAPAVPSSCAPGNDGFFPTDPGCSARPEGPFLRAALLLVIPVVYSWAEAVYQEVGPVFTPPELGGGLDSATRQRLLAAYGTLQALLDMLDGSPASSDL